MEALRIYICDDIDYVVGKSLTQVNAWYRESMQLGDDDIEIRELRNYNTEFYIELGSSSDVLDALAKGEDTVLSFMRKGDCYWEVTTFAKALNSIGIFTEPFIICGTEY